MPKLALQHTSHIHIFRPIAHHIHSRYPNAPDAIHGHLGRHSTVLLWSRSAFNTIHSSQSYTFHHTLLYLPHHRDVLCWKVYDLQAQTQVPLKQARMTPVTKSTASLCKGGLGIQGGSSDVVLPMRISPVMWMKFSGQIQLGEEIMSRIFYSVFSVFFIRFILFYFHFCNF